MKSASLELQTCLAPMPFNNATCSGLRTMLTSGTSSARQIFCSICPRFEAAAVWANAEWPSMRMVSTMPSAVNGLTKQDAPSRAVVPSWSGSASEALTLRYWAYMAPPNPATVLPSSPWAVADVPAATTVPAPSLPTGMD